MSYCCKYCDREYIGGNKKNNVLTHEKYCSLNPERQKYFCVECCREFDNRYAFSGHKKNCGKVIKRLKEKKEKIHECKYCNLTFDNGLQLGGHIINCKSDPEYEEKRRSRSDKLSNVGKNRKLSDETKKKISESRKKYLLENPDMVPYKLNHSSKESYPEKYFSELFLKENIKVERYYYVSIYELDFCVIDKKIDIEIDGEQHFVDDGIRKSDENRNKYLQNLGWTIIRIRWSDYQKLSIEEKKNYISDLKKLL